MRTKLAVVTGASSGIGAATARWLGEAGYDVILVARGQQALEAVAQDMAGRGVPEALDAGDGEAVLQMAARVIARHGAPDVIVNSAGAGRWKFIEETPPAEALQMLQAPYLAAYNVTHAFMAQMIARGDGVIVHVGSPASLIPWPGATGYTAARWALRGLHEALRQDLRGTGVHSCHVVFGEVASQYFERNPDSHQHIPKIARFMRVLSPQECAEVIGEVIADPRDVVHPWMLRALYACAAIAPGLMRELVGMTGRSH